MAEARSASRRRQAEGSSNLALETTKRRLLLLLQVGVQESTVGVTSKTMRMGRLVALHVLPYLGRGRNTRVVGCLLEISNLRVLNMWTGGEHGWRARPQHKAPEQLRGHRSITYSYKSHSCVSTSECWESHACSEFQRIALLWKDRSQMYTTVALWPGWAFLEQKR